MLVRSTDVGDAVSLTTPRLLHPCYLLCHINRIPVSLAVERKLSKDHRNNKLNASFRNRKLESDLKVRKHSA